MTDQLTWQQWRDERTETLSQPHGWLSLTSLTWVSPEGTTLPDFPGQWQLTAAPDTASSNDGTYSVTAHFAPQDGVARDGESVDGTVAVALARGESDQSLTCGDVVAEVAQRGDGVIVRVRNPETALRTGFSGVPVWDFDPEWVRPCVIAWDAEPSTVPVQTAQPGLVSKQNRLGVATVVLPGGATAKLVVTGSVDEPFVIFHDDTNGVDSPGWRTAPVVAESPLAAGHVDFNRAQVFPARFTPFGTCPMPPEGNRVPTRVEAGEKDPAKG